jgi:hypothetical protein
MLNTMAGDHNKVMAKMDANQEKSEADRKTDTERMIARMDAIQETTVRMDAKMGSMREEIKSAIK